MKVILPSVKPRAKWLNDILKSKRNTKHASLRHPSRADLKKESDKLIKDFTLR